MADEKNPFMDMFTSFGEQMKIPGPDLNDLMDAHRKNLAALQAATQIGTGAAQAVMDKQREALEETLADIAETVKNATNVGEGGAAAMAPLDLAKRSFDATLRNASDVSEIVKQGNMDAFNVLKDRVTESIQEMTGKQDKS